MRFGSILQNPHVEKVGIVMNSKIELEGLSSNQPYIAIHVILIPTKKMQHAFQRFIDFIAGWWWGSKVLLSRLHSAFVCVTEGPLIHLEPQMFAPTPWVHTQQAKRRSCRLPILHQRIQVPKMEGCLNLKWGCFGGGVSHEFLCVGFTLDLPPTDCMPWNIFRFGNPNPKLCLLLLLGREGPPSSKWDISKYNSWIWEEQTPPWTSYGHTSWDVFGLSSVWLNTWKNIILLDFSKRDSDNNLDTFSKSQSTQFFQTGCGIGRNNSKFKCKSVNHRIESPFHWFGSYQKHNPPPKKKQQQQQQIQ